VHKKLKDNWRIVAALAVILVLIGFFFWRNATHPTIVTADCSTPYRYDSTVKVNSHTIKTEDATTKASRAIGLGNRACIGQDVGMLFIFRIPGHYQFWMKDMRFPIDIVWISPQHKAVDVLRDVKPSTYPYSFANKGQTAQYVLELASNRTSTLGINPGTLINF